MISREITRNRGLRRSVLSACALLLAILQVLLVLPAAADGEYPRYYQSMFSSVRELKAAGEALVREVEGEGVVLLKNEGNVLPLPAGSDVALVGVTVLNPVYSGTGSGNVDTSNAPDYRDVIRDAGFHVVSEALLNEYSDAEARRNNNEIGEKPWAWVRRKAKNDDGDMVIGNGEHVIYVVGRVGGEGNDLVETYVEDTLDGDYLTLNEDELSILEALGEMREDEDIASLTVIINSANPISADFINNEDYCIDAALWVGSVGQTGLYAVADVLTGAVNPSGSLPDTWWVDNQSNPVNDSFGDYTYTGAGMYDFSNGNQYSRRGPYENYVVYQEGVYLGYRYTETRYEDVVLGTPNAGSFNYSSVVAYPFGYGLSYTEFELSDMRAVMENRTTPKTSVLTSQADAASAGERSENVWSVSVTVTNTGARAGKKTVQVYAQKPYTDYDRQQKIEKPSVELVGYAKTQLLMPGESEELLIEVPEYFLTSYDALQTGAFILSGGTHYLTAASDAHEAVNNILSAKGKTVSDGMTAPGRSDLVVSCEYEHDGITYASAYGTGARVRSLFAEADFNRYSGNGGNSVVYYSRSNWTGTVGRDTPELPMTPRMAADMLLTDDDLPDDAGVAFPIMGLNTGMQLIDMMDCAYDDPQWDAFMDQLTFEELAMLCANGLRMTYEVPSVGKPRTLDHNGPLGVTQTYGGNAQSHAVVQNDPDKNLRGTAYPCNGILAATFNDKLINRVGTMVGEDCMWAGYAGIYGTGLNLHRSPYAGRVFEYFSEDSILTGLIGTAWTLGVQSRGVYVYNKHFVLNEQEDNRAGLSTWCNEQALRELYLRAFELPIVYADAKCVMTAFNRLGAQWTGSCRELLTDWLRGEAGMSGFAVTDMYDSGYMSMVHEVVAGNDLPDGMSDDGSEFADYGPDGDKANAVVVNCMRESAKRVLYTVLHSRGMDGIESNGPVK